MIELCGDKDVGITGWRVDRRKARLGRVCCIRRTELVVIVEYRRNGSDQWSIQQQDTASMTLMPEVMSDGRR